jgi:hypothetical protein
MRVALLSLVLAVLPFSAQGQQLAADDTSGVLAAVLSHYRTVNGPIVQIARTVACGDPRYTGQARLAENLPCRSAGIDSVISQYAAMHAVDLIDVTGEVPPCRWSEESSSNRQGLRLELMAPDITDGVVRAGVLVRCQAVVRGSVRGFMHGVIYEMKQEEGAWKVARIISSMIT